jgi:hypothetical protein
MFLVLPCELSLIIILFYVVQGGSVIISGPGGPPVASVTPQTSELVGDFLHMHLFSCYVVVLLFRPS